jgi:hypothetical protein
MFPQSQGGKPDMYPPGLKEAASLLGMGQLGNLGQFDQLSQLGLAGINPNKNTNPN